MPHHVYKPKGSINWHISVKIKGRNRIRRSSGTPDKAKAQAIASRIEAREWKHLTEGDRAATTFSDAVMDYVSDGKSAGFLLKLVKHFKDTPLIDIKAGHIRSAARVIYPDAKAATWNRQVITPARAVINHAASKGIVPHIIVESFPVQSVPRRDPGKAWMAAFLGSAKPRLGALMLFMRTTGTPIGQALGLTWQDFDLQNAVVAIPERNKGKGYPARLAELTPQLVALLAALEGPRLGQVFGYKARGSGLYKAIRKACADAKIDYVPTHPVGRRGFFTTMHRAGIDVKTASRRGGLASTRLALEVYTDDDEQVGLIGDVFGTFETKTPMVKQGKSK